MIRKKSILMFLALMMALAVSGYWLYSGGWLHIPRVLDVPAVLGGGSANGRVEGAARPMPDGTGAADTGRPEGFENGFSPDGRGEHGHGGNGLNWNLLPSVLANLWIVVVIITGVVYGMKVLPAVVNSIRRTPTPAVV